MEKVIVGKIINTHGVRGELKVDRTNNETFDRDVDYFIGETFEKVEISKSRISGNLAYIKLKNMDDINLVLKYKTKFIYVNKTDLYKLEQDEYFVKDLIGLEVIDMENKYIGKIKDVLSYAANDVYIIACDKGQDIMIPAVKEFIKSIDIENKIIKVELIEGM